MKKILISLILLLSTFTFSKENISNIEIKDFKTNKIVKVKEFKKKTYIKLWASWCPHCTNSLEELEELSSNKNLDFKVISVVFPKIYDKNEKDFIAFWNNLDFKNTKVFFDNEGKLAKKIKLNAFPTNVFVNSRGEVETIVEGVINNDEIISIMNKIK